MQNHFLTPPQKLKINKVLYKIQEVGFYYDCNDCLRDIENCKNNEKCGAFHFLQKNHFAFDSILYNGIDNTLVLIQITINKYHTEKYEDIYRYTRKTKNMKQPENKYHQFFLDLTQKKLVTTYIFQWITNEKYDEIKKKADEFRKNKKMEFTIEYYSQDFFELRMHNKQEYIQ